MGERVPSGWLGFYQAATAACYRLFFLGLMRNWIYLNRLDTGYNYDNTTEYTRFFMSFCWRPYTQVSRGPICPQCCQMNMSGRYNLKHLLTNGEILQVNWRCWSNGFNLPDRENSWKAAAGIPGVIHDFQLEDKMTHTLKGLIKWLQFTRSGE